MLSLWQRLPVIVRAVVTGLGVAVTGTIPWAILVKANLKYWTVVPWAVLPTALYLWLFWRYLQGAYWPRSTANARRTNCRANHLSPEVWGAALFAGMVGLICVVLLLAVMNRLVRLPAQNFGDLSHVPRVTLFFFLIMSSVVAGIAEESAFRGYLQGPIERRHGPVIAILVTGVLFGFMHFSHPEVSLFLMPYYMAVAAVYGALAYFTNSILPSLVLHAGGNIFTGIDLLTRGNAEWQVSSSPAPLLWETGTDASFWIVCVALLLMGAAAVWAYAMLANITRKAHELAVRS